MPGNLVRPYRPRHRPPDGPSGAPERGNRKEGDDEIEPIWAAPAPRTRAGYFWLGRRGGTSMTTISQFDEHIRRLTGEHPESRPFICDGSPFDCEVAEIGINPGTPTPFWPHWSASRGLFDKQAWLNDYLDRHGKFGPTRRNIDLFSQALHPLRCLELNVYDRFASRSAQLAPNLRTTHVLDYLLEALRPRLVLVHGDPPAEHLSRLFGVTLVKERFVPVAYRGVRLEVFQAKGHFMKVSKDYVRELASTFNQRARTAANHSLNRTHCGMRLKARHFILGL